MKCVRTLVAIAAAASVAGCASGKSSQTKRETAASAPQKKKADRPPSDATTPRAPATAQREDARKVPATAPRDDERKAPASGERRGTYTVDGRVAGVGGVLHRSVRIERQGADAAELRIADDTRVLLEGREAKLDDVHEGDQVRATFELRGDAPTAIELRVRPGTGAR
jgi:hypothetical protein